MADEATNAQDITIPTAELDAFLKETQKLVEEANKMVADLEKEAKKEAGTSAPATAGIAPGINSKSLVKYGVLVAAGYAIYSMVREK